MVFYVRSVALLLLMSLLSVSYAKFSATISFRNPSPRTLGEEAAIQAYNRLRSAGLTSSRSTTDFTDGNGKKMMATTYVLSGETSAAKLVEHAQALRNSFPDLFTMKDLAAVKAIRARFNTDKTVQDILQNKPFISITLTTVQPASEDSRREPQNYGSFGHTRSSEFTLGGHVGYSPQLGANAGITGTLRW